MKKIDAHAHVGQSGGWAGVDSTAEGIVRLMEQYEVERTILCARDHMGNEEVVQACREYPDKFWPLVYVNPLEGAEACRKKIGIYTEEHGFMGIKMNPLRHAFVADDLCVDPVMEEAERRGLPVFIHSGHPPYSLPWSIALLAERYPSVKVVMIHMGHGHGVYIDAALKMAKRYPNIYLEMSGMPMGVKIREAYRQVGPDRILFGTDFTVYEPEAFLLRSRHAFPDPEEQKKLYSGNLLSLLKSAGAGRVFYSGEQTCMQ